MAESTQDSLDYFAGQAMRAILSNNEMVEAITGMGTQAVTYDEAIRAIVKKSFDIASAMVMEKGERRRLEPEFIFKPKKPL